jgi:hypothetical protein
MTHRLAILPLASLMALVAVVALFVPTSSAQTGQLSCVATIDHGPQGGGKKEDPPANFVSEQECEDQAKNAESSFLGQPAAAGDRCSCSTGSVGTGPGGASRKLEPRGFGNLSLQTVAGRFANVLTGISGSVALLMFVYGGFLWLTSAGDSGKVEKGKEVIFAASLGLFVIFSAYAILSAIFRALGAGT